MSNVDDDNETPICPNRLFNFSKDAVIVTDADEEILELYMNLASTSDDEGERTEVGGLGFLDSTKSVLDVDLALMPPEVPSGGVSMPQSEIYGSNSGRRRKTALKKGIAAKEIRIEVQIQQDLMALKGRKGDTGSVLWRSSLHLARHLLMQHYFLPVHPANPLLDSTALASARILELGSGTGLLAVLLNPLCQSYTASDRLENLKLVHSNLLLNSIKTSATRSKVKEEVIGDNDTSKPSRKAKAVPASNEAVKEVLLEEIDWVAISDERQRRQARIPTATTDTAGGSVTSPLSSYSLSPTSPRSSYFPPFEPRQHPDDGGYDLVLAVDCIYNESLVQPLIDTLANYCPTGGKTVVWVVVELRSSDVLSLFLDKWLTDSSGPWTVVRLGPEAMGRWEGHRPRWVGWVGWR